LFNAGIDWQKRYREKKGRLLSVGVKLNNDYYFVTELDNISNSINQNVNSYFINGNRTLSEIKYAVNADFIEPLDDATYCNWFVDYAVDRQRYTPGINSDTTISYSDVAAQVINYFIKPGYKFQKKGDKFLLNAAVTGILDSRSVAKLNMSSHTSFLAFDMKIQTDYVINKDANVNLNFERTTSYPGPEQLTNIGNTFDLVSFATGNLYLLPEVKNTVDFTYKSVLANNGNLYLSGAFDHYTNKFGFVVSSLLNSPTEIQMVSNVGSANSARILISYFNNTSNNSTINCSSGINYSQTPSVINGVLVNNSIISANGSFSADIKFPGNFFYITPTVSTMLNRVFYETGNFDIVTFTYSDKITFQCKKVQLALFPLLNYNHSFGNNTSFSMNGGLKKTVFKGYGSLWIQGYNIFNSFKFINNYVGPSAYQAVKYSNLQRFILIGLSAKFNNMK